MFSAAAPTPPVAVVSEAELVLVANTAEPLASALSEPFCRLRPQLLDWERRTLDDAAAPASPCCSPGYSSIWLLR